MVDIPRSVQSFGSWWNSSYELYVQYTLAGTCGVSGRIDTWLKAGRRHRFCAVTGCRPFFPTYLSESEMTLNLMFYLRRAVVFMRDSWRAVEANNKTKARGDACVFHPLHL